MTDRCRVINFHNLDTANEGKRLTAFSVFDMTDSLPGTCRNPLEPLRSLMNGPVNRKHTPRRSGSVWEQC